MRQALSLWRVGILEGKTIEMFMKSFLKNIRNVMLAGVARREDIDRLYEQIAGLLQIRNAMEGHSVLKPMRGWAISPDAMAWVLASLQEYQQATAMEFGSGQSTIILGSALKHWGGKLISVEHDPDYRAVIQRQVEACGLQEVVRFLDVPLVEGAKGIVSYDEGALPEMKIDLALIDGPPCANGLLTRFVPLHWSFRHLKEGGVIYLDDADREAECTCLARLAAEFPDAEQFERKAEKGLVEVKKK